MTKIAPVSIVVPCYNGSLHLREALESAVSQSLRPLEVIMVDDGSTDDSVEIAAGFGSSVQVLRQDNQGVSAARNAGLRQASGDYVLFLDADDLLAPNALAALHQRFEPNPSSAIVMSCASFETSPQFPCRTWNATNDVAFFPHVMQGCIGVCHTWLIPRQIVLGVSGFDVNVHIYQFWHFLCKVALTGAGCVPIDFIGAYYRQSPTSMIHGASPESVATGHVRVQTLLCREIVGARPDLLEKHGDVMFWSAWTALHRARVLALPESQTAELAEAIRQIARSGPPAVRRTRFARLVRLVGARRADHIRSLVYST